MVLILIRRVGCCKGVCEGFLGRGLSHAGVVGGVGWLARSWGLRDDWESTVFFHAWEGMFKVSRGYGFAAFPWYSRVIVE